MPQRAKPVHLVKSYHRKKMPLETLQHPETLVANHAAVNVRPPENTLAFLVVNVVRPAYDQGGGTEEGKGGSSTRFCSAEI